MSERWPKVVFGLIGLNMVIVGVTVYAATSDATFGVEPEYDRRAMAWDDVKRDRSRSEALGWRVEATAEGGSLVIRVKDAGGSPVADAVVRAEVFHALRPSDRRSTDLVERSPGEYAGALGMTRPGSWEVRLSARRGGDRFVADTRVEAGHGATP